MLQLQESCHSDKQQFHVEPTPRRPLRLLLAQSSFLLLLITCAVRLSAQTEPKRIVSTAPSITETLFALGVGSRVVGVSQFCDYPPEVRRLPKVGSYIRPDPEAIAQLAPDLVILERQSNQLTERLSTLHIPFIQVPHATLDDIYTEIRLIGSAVGVPNRSAALVTEIRNSLASIQTKTHTVLWPRVLVIVDRQQGTLDHLVAVGPGNYLNQILEIAGGTNVLARDGVPAYPRISLETVLRENPDVIIDLSGTQESKESRQVSRVSTLALWAQYRDLAAVRAGRVYAGTTDSLVVPGPRTPVATKQLFDFIHERGHG